MAFGAAVRYDYSKNMAYHINQMTYSKNLIEFRAARSHSKANLFIWDYACRFPKGIAELRLPSHSPTHPPGQEKIDIKKRHKVGPRAARATKC